MIDCMYFEHQIGLLIELLIVISATGDAKFQPSNIREFIL